MRNKIIFTQIMQVELQYGNYIQLISWLVDIYLIPILSFMLYDHIVCD